MGTEGEKPHVSGYIQSSSSSDGKPYKIIGWFNEDGRLRVEIIKK